YISSLIAVLYLITCGHCFWRTRAIAREGEVARGCRAVLSAPNGAKAPDADARGLPGGLVTDHIRSLVTKARAQAAGRIDQTQRGFSDTVMLTETHVTPVLASRPGTSP